MSILVKGMKWPIHCSVCDFSIYDDGYRGGYGYGTQGYICKHLNRYVKQDKVPCDCPLVVVPTPHGRLIAVDDLISHLKDTGIWETLPSGAKAIIHAAPIIIETEE